MVSGLGVGSWGWLCSFKWLEADTRTKGGVAQPLGQVFEGVGGSYPFEHLAQGLSCSDCGMRLEGEG